MNEKELNLPMQKWKADLIHDGYRFKKNQVLVAEDDGRILDLISEKKAGSDIKSLEGILCPGFVNTHCHLELSHLKGQISEHTGLVNFLIAVMTGRSNFSKEMIGEAEIMAEKEMLKNGIVAIGDISNGTDSLLLKKDQHLYYHTFVEGMGITGKNATASFHRSFDVLNAFKEAGLSAAIVPHAPYSVSRSLFQLINTNNTSLLSIHNQEAEAENDLYNGKKSDFYRLYDELGLDYSDFLPTRKSSLQSYQPYFTNHQPFLFVHNTYTSETDIIEAEKSQHTCYWCLCPNANLYIENQLPPVHTLRKQGATITLGTDSLASNHQLSILAEIKTLQSHFPEISLEEMLRWATSNGAKALQCDEQFGSFEKGKKPGVVWIKDISKENFPTLQPHTMMGKIV